MNPGRVAKKSCIDYYHVVCHVHAHARRECQAGAKVPSCQVAKCQVPKCQVPSATSATCLMRYGRWCVLYNALNLPTVPTNCTNYIQYIQRRGLCRVCAVGYCDWRRSELCVSMRGSDEFAVLSVPFVYLHSVFFSLGSIFIP